MSHLHYCSSPHSFSAPSLPWNGVRAIVLGYYDGETNGIMQCGACDTAYSFSMLDADDGQDIRVFALSRLPANSFGKLSRLLSSLLGKPGWPIWVPLWQFTSQQDEALANGAIQETLSEARPVEAVFACKSVQAEILALRMVKPAEFEMTTDWLAALGVPRQCAD